MVSLSRSFNTNSGGATFFSESVNMNDQEQLQPILESFGGFKKVQTVPIFSFHILFTLIINIIAIVYAVTHPDEKSRCREYFVVIYLHIVLWFITFAIHITTKCIHHKARLNGYLDFYKSTDIHTNLPLSIVSLWTVALLFMQTLMQHYYPDDFEQKCLNPGTMSPRAYLCALITIEFCAIAGVNISYMLRVMAFNKLQPPPDVLKSEWLASGNPETFTQNEVGYREMGHRVYDFLEKQADLIRYLKEHNEKLNETVMKLSNRLRSGSSGASGSGPVQS